MAYRGVALVGRAVERHFAEYRGRIGFELRVTSLGHIQRGGIPTFSDRLLATMLWVPLRQSTLPKANRCQWLGL